ncbi:IspD/TarI family cytidylyltransferase [Leuconostoc carnosum]|uniref:IspD/TarI family cytidylyltransferase n=1 Tax=Leuconostoc carnosum TaxID=1252 RepID=UPI00123AE630|nr:IspD/TarI family cytidylyltransferase [Leuconostoc carnosum]KAA8368003.1 2-C-methyl-D-erythritol 4-phosphate cytidylyltransferase [Leuconostoc carnosum]
MKYNNVVLIFAGGVGSRMNNGSLPKQFLEVEGKPIIIHTLEIFEKSQDIDGIFISITPSWKEFLYKLIKKYDLQKVVKIVEGGETSQISQYNALKAMNEFVNEKTIVLIHDGVRPLIDNEVIKNNIDSVTKHGNAITVKKAIETVITVSNDNQVEQVLNRDDYRMAVAPQSYHYKDIYSAHSKAINLGQANFVDSAQLMQNFGMKLFYVDGTTNNIKITTPIDYYIFKGILEARRVNEIF